VRSMQSNEQAGVGRTASSVPLDEIVGLIETFGIAVERDETGFSFQARFNRTRLNVRPVDQTASDGSRVTDVVTIHTDLPEFPLAHLGAERGLSALNMNAVMSALVSMRRGQVTRLVNRLSVFEGDHECWKLYTPMLSFAAVSQSDAFYQTVKQADPSQDHGDTEVLPEANSGSPWDASDFDQAQELLDRVGVLAFSDATGLSAELLWDEGTVSHMERLFAGGGGRTSLLRLTTTERHPALGGGLLCRLVLPVSYPEETLPKVACRLNLLELVAIDASPFFGAWTVDPETRSVTFVSFLPNVLYRCGVVANLTSWAIARNQRAKRSTEVDTTLCTLARESQAQPMTPTTMSRPR
jgi:hypothetical protein